MKILTATQLYQPGGVPHLSLTCTSKEPAELGDVFILYYYADIKFTVISMTANKDEYIYTLEEEGSAFGDDPLTIEELRDFLGLRFHA